jgi:hypothetical protein
MFPTIGSSDRIPETIILTPKNEVNHFPLLIEFVLFMYASKSLKSLGFHAHKRKICLKKTYNIIYVLYFTKPTSQITLEKNCDFI